jgi:hypothetical protein
MLTIMSDIKAFLQIVTIAVSTREVLSPEEIEERVE